MHADKLPITGPCPIDLDAIGFDRSAKVAHCSHCTKNVHVLSNMTRGEAREFLATHKGKKLCISYSCDDEGKIRFKADAPEPAPEPALVPVTRLRPRIATAARASTGRSRAAGLVAAFGVTAALAACAPHQDDAPQGDRVVRKEQAEPKGETTKRSTRFTDALSDLLDEPESKPQPQVDPKPQIDPQPEIDPVPLAGAAVIPEEMIDGEIEVPDPATIGLAEPEPCDSSKEGTPKKAEIAVAGMAML